MKKYFKMAGLFLGISLVVGITSVYGQEIKKGVGDVVNNYYGETVVNQSVENTSDSDGELGISDQSGGFVITKTVTNSNIATSTNTYTGIDLTNTVSGALIIEEIVVSADTTGLATTTPGTSDCTGIIITIEGNSASTTPMTINSFRTLEANETVDYGTASSSIKARLDNGSNLQVLPLGDSCDSAGETTFTMFFKKVDERSFIYE